MVNSSPIAVISAGRYNRPVMKTKDGTPSRVKVWIGAMRPRTLPLAISSVGMGTFLAASHDAVDWPVALLCFVTAILLQILSNLANDYGDTVHGADHLDRVGPSRAVQTGQITPQAMKRVIILFAALSVATGLGTLWLALGTRVFWIFVFFLFLGATALGASISYTAGSKPYGYAGLGDIAVLVFFGWAGVIGSHYLQVQQVEWDIWLPATSTGMLIVAVLNVNNIRDIESDKQAGKLSLPVRLGPHKARIYHWALLLSAVLGTMIYVVLNYQGYWQFLFLITLPLIWQNGRTIYVSEASQLDPMLKKTSLLTILFVLTFGLGQLI